MTLAVVHHPGYVAPLPRGHRFPMNKYGMLIRHLRVHGLTGAARFHRPEPADPEVITLAHDADYVARVFDRALDERAERRIGFALTRRVVRRVRLSCAGTTLAGRLALETGIACNTAGGSHHAHAGFGSGFCVFNDVAVAIAALRAAGAINRALVVDLDVHQGDGTAAIFAGDGEVLTFSMHCEQNFPVRKARGDLDRGLSAGTGDQAYLAELTDILADLIGHHRPDIVFYNAGVDPHVADKLGRLALTDEGIRARDSLVVRACRSAGVPLATVVGGGYGDDLDRLARLHSLVITAAAGSGLTDTTYYQSAEQN